MLTITPDPQNASVIFRRANGNLVSLRDPGSPDFFQKLLDLEIRHKGEPTPKRLLPLLSHACLVAPTISLKKWRRMSQDDLDRVAVAMTHLKSFKVFIDGE